MPASGVECEREPSRARAALRSEPWTSAQWRDHFRRNRDSLLTIPWDTVGELTPAERRTIARSVQIFQKGESGEGRHFLKCATRYADRTGDAEYVDAVRLLIAEEQRHAADLGRFLDLSGIGRIRRNWSNGVFRRLRKLAGLETIVAVLVAAEIIAKVYYRALYGATTCPALRRLCAQILRDEEAHVRFQCERLELLRRNNPWWLARLKECAHAALFRATCLVVWWTHRPVFIAGGLSLRRYCRQAVIEFRKA